jgi:hypothetical protein
MVNAIASFGPMGRIGVRIEVELTHGDQKKTVSVTLGVRRQGGQTENISVTLGASEDGAGQGYLGVRYAPLAAFGAPRGRMPAPDVGAHSGPPR